MSRYPGIRIASTERALRSHIAGLSETYIFAIHHADTQTMPSDALRRLDRIASSLPFAPDDIAAVNAAFASWRAGRTDRRDVDIWIYVYVHRYFVLKFARESGGSPSDLDAAATRAYEKATGHLDAIRDPDRFAQYVSVVCKRTLLNDRRSRRGHDELDEALPAETTAQPEDPAVVRHALAVAISALPEGLREPARLRFLEGLGYDAMAQRTGRDVPTMRTYVSKARRRLATDAALRAMQYDDVLPDGADPGRAPPS